MIPYAMMPHCRYYRVVRAAVMAVLLVSNPASSANKVEPMTNPLKFEAGTCQSCHPQHYAEWQQSYHAKSVVAIQPDFKKYIITQEQIKGRPLNRNELMGCMGCHGPAMRFASNEDFTRLARLVKTDQKEALARLSVDCLACHTLFGSGRPEVR